MGLETASFINQLQPANPSGADRLQQGDDHIRLLKQVLKSTFPNLTGAMTLTQATLNALPSQIVPAGVITLWYGEDEDCPAGWAICNGQTVPRSSGSGTIMTPDLRGRVAVGVSDSFPYGSTGGAASRTLTTEAAGEHAHTGTATAAGEHSHDGETGSTALALAQIPSHTHRMAAAVAVDTELNLGPDQTVAWRTTSSPGESEYALRASGSSEATLGKTGSTGSSEGHKHAISPSGQHSHTIAVAGAGSHTHSIASFSTMPPYGALHYIMKV